jgi:hypothetical protein
LYLVPFFVPGIEWEEEKTEGAITTTGEMADCQYMSVLLLGQHLSVLRAG